MQRIEQFIQTLSTHELLQIKHDLDNESKYLKHIVHAQIMDIETKNCKCCATCGIEIQQNMQTLTLVFGPSDFRKKATLCGADCMDAFLGKIKDLERKTLLQEAK